MTQRVIQLILGQISRVLPNEHVFTHSIHIKREKNRQFERKNIRQFQLQFGCQTISVFFRVRKQRFLAIIFIQWQPKKTASYNGALKLKTAKLAHFHFDDEKHYTTIVTLQEKKKERARNRNPLKQVLAKNAIHYIANVSRFWCRKSVGIVFFFSLPLLLAIELE